METADPRSMEIGAAQADGTIFAGISPDTKKPIFVRPQDETNADGSTLTTTWKEAMEHAAQFEGHGREKGSFRLPTKGELTVLFKNRAKIGGFNLTGNDPEGWYWSSTECGNQQCTYELAHDSEGGPALKVYTPTICLDAWMHRFLENDPDLWYFSKVSCEASLRLVCD